MNSSIRPNNDRKDVKKCISMKFDLEIIIVGLVLLRSYYLYIKLFDLIVDSGFGVR
jgi:hypothetical protein